MQKNTTTIKMSVLPNMTAFSSPSVLGLAGRTTLYNKVSCCSITARVATPPPKPTSTIPKTNPSILFNGKAPKKEASLVVEGDFLESTPLQQLQVYGFFGLTTIEFINLLTQDHTIQVAIGVLIGYIFADLATGVYHWAVDNYGSGETPVLGRQIAAFQGHHNAPWTIAQRAFANNLAALTVPVTPQLVGLIAVSSHLPAIFTSFYASSLLFIVLSQEAHRQAHFTRASPIFERLQNLGLSLPKRMHGKHHAEPYGVNYCIVSGLWNGVLDNGKVFRRLEKLVYRLTGNEPIAWKLDEQLKKEALRL